MPNGKSHSTRKVLICDVSAIWRPTPNDDYGLDGELEFTRDGAMTGFIVKVQVKTGPSYLRNKTASGFDYYVSAPTT
jgi:hypothetical protein